MCKQNPGPGGNPAPYSGGRNLAGSQPANFQPQQRQPVGIANPFQGAQLGLPQPMRPQYGQQQPGIPAPLMSQQQQQLFRGGYGGQQPGIPAPGGYPQQRIQPPVQRGPQLQGGGRFQGPLQQGPGQGYRG